MKRPLAEADSRALSLSVRLFERLLAVYPQAHRRAYGPAMVQVFRDQCMTPSATDGIGSYMAVGADLAGFGQDISSGTRLNAQ